MFNISLSDWIQLGMLFLAFISLVASLRIFFFKRKLSSSITFIKWSPIYLTEVILDFNSKAFVSKVSCWLETKLINNNTIPLLISEINCYEEQGDKRIIFNKPVSKYKINNLGVEVKESLNFPIEVDAHKGFNFAFLADFVIPEKLGTIIFIMYNKAILDLPAVSKFHYAATHTDLAFKSVFDKSAHLGIQIKDLKISSLTSKLPVVIETDKDIHIYERIITLPYDIKTDVYKFCHNHTIKPGSLFISPAKRYYIEFVFGNGKVLKKKFNINGDVFWFKDQL